MTNWLLYDDRLSRLLTSHYHHVGWRLLQKDIQRDTLTFVPLHCRHTQKFRLAFPPLHWQIEIETIKLPFPDGGAGMAQWLEHRTRDWKVAGSNPCWNGGRIFFSRVDFLCWLLFRYPFHPRVTAVARKKSRSFCQKCRWQVTAKHAYTLRMWILLNRASALVTTCP